MFERSVIKKVRKQHDFCILKVFQVSVPKKIFFIRFGPNGKTIESLIDEELHKRCDHLTRVFERCLHMPVANDWKINWQINVFNMNYPKE